VIVVSNASPLIILTKIGQLELLKDLYGGVTVPAEVHAEIVPPGVDLPGAKQLAQATWLDIRRLSSPEALGAAQTQFSLARGELSAILLAEELRADLILLDERAARRMAQSRGLRVRGCVGILETAYRTGRLTDLRQAYAQFLEQRVYLDKRILNTSLASLGLPPL
jgi:uncharacterized protein